MKKFRFFSVLLLIILSIGLYYSYETNKIDVNIDDKLKEVAITDYFEKEINLLISNNNFQEAEKYFNLSKYLNVKLDENIISQLNKTEEESFISNITNKSKDIYSGFIKGEVNNETQFYSSIASDLTVVGDARDFYSEGVKFVNNEDYDKLILGLASVGLVFSASQVATMGASTPIKLGASIIKVAARTGELSKSFIKLISKKISKTIDFNIIKKNVNFESLNKAKDSFKYVKNNVNISHIKKLGTMISTLKDNTSLYDSTKLLKYVDSEKDLNKLVTISNKYKKNTRTVMKILGKNVLKATKTIVKYSSLFLIQLFVMILSFISLLISFIFPSLLLRILKPNKI